MKIFFPAFGGQFYLDDSLARDHWRTLNTLSPHLWCICQQRVFLQMIQLWHLLTNSLFYINSQNIFVTVKNVSNIVGMM